MARRKQADIDADDLANSRNLPRNIFLNLAWVLQKFPGVARCSTEFDTSLKSMSSKLVMDDNSAWKVVIKLERIS